MEEVSFFEMPQFKCLESLVGISQKECACFPEIPTEKTALIRTTQTGLFVDEHEMASGIIQLAKASCGDGDVWEQMISARKEAVLKVILDVSVNLNRKFTTIPKYKHEIGENKYSSLGQSTTQNKSLTIKTKAKIGAKMKVSGFGLIAKIVSGNPLEVIRVTIKNKTTDTIIKAFDFDVKPIAWMQPDNTIYDIEPFAVPCDGSEYEFSYNTGGVIVPYENLIVCACEGVRREFNKFIEVKTGYADGLMVMTEFFCDENYLLCQIANSNMTLRMLTADAIRVLTTYKFISSDKAKSKNGTTVNNVLNIKNLDDTLGTLNAEYSALMTDLVEKMAGLNTDLGCFTCNQTFNRNRTQGIVLTDSNPLLNYNELSGTYEYASDNFSQLVKSREAMPIVRRNIFNI